MNIKKIIRFEIMIFFFFIIEIQYNINMCFVSQLSHVRRVNSQEHNIIIHNR